MEAKYRQMRIVTVEGLLQPKYPELGKFDHMTWLVSTTEYRSSKPGGALTIA